MAFAKPYRANIGLNIIFNLLAVIFALGSLALVVPVLEVIFNTTETALHPPVNTGDYFSYFKEYLYYEIGTRMDQVGQADALLYVCFWVIGAFFLKNLFNYLALFFITPLRNGITRDIRLQMHDKILNLPIGYFTEQRKGDIISRMTSDLKEIEWSILQTIEGFFREPVMIIGSLIILFTMSVKLTLLVFIVLPVIALVLTLIGKSLKRSSAKAQSKMGELMSRVEEDLTGLKVIKAFNAEDVKRELFGKVVNHYFRLMNSVTRKSDLASPLSEFLGAVMIAFVIWYGGGLVMEDNGFTAEQFIAYILFFYQIIAPAKALSRASSRIQRGNASAERVLQILDAENPIQDPPQPKSLPEFSKSLDLKDINFAYQEKNVLHNFNLSIEKGKTIALVGQSGSGKSTITNLIPRFYDVENGAITIDGINIKDLDLHTLRKQFGIVTQESILFNETVRYNIALGKPNTPINEIIEAAKVANAHEFIEQLPQGYDTPIGDAGGRLSGGQRQRLSIARAVLKNPPILILDEATSALDTESEKLVQEALYKLMRNRTSLVVAHRLSTIQHADEIIVMENGEIAERGTHQELLDKTGIYRKLVEMQSFG